MSDNSLLFGEDQDEFIYDFNEISDDEEEEEEEEGSTIESTESPQELNDEEAQYEPNFKVEKNYKKVGISSKDSAMEEEEEEEELLMGQKSPSKAESRKNSIQSLRDEIRLQRKSLENADAEPFQLDQKNLNVASQMSRKSIVSSASLKPALTASKDSRKTSANSNQLTLDEKQKPKKISIGETHFKSKQAERISLGQITLTSFTNTTMFQAMYGPPRKNNTYQLEPKKIFSEHEAMLVIDGVFETYLGGVHTYDPQITRDLVKMMASDIRTRLIINSYDRYKITVHVIMGEKRMHGLNIDARCLWDSERDHFICKQIETFDYFVLVMCCGVYHD